LFCSWRIAILLTTRIHLIREQFQLVRIDPFGQQVKIDSSVGLNAECRVSVSSFNTGYWLTLTVRHAPEPRAPRQIRESRARVRHGHAGTDAAFQLAVNFARCAEIVRLYCVGIGGRV